MKTFVFLSFLLVAIVTVMAQDYPPPESPWKLRGGPVPPPEQNEVAQQEEERADRHRRVTCDLLSIKAKGISVEHAACAANCLSMGKAGGRCKDGVCLCRQTTFKELWDKRFD